MALQEQIELAFKQTVPQHNLCAIINKQSEIIKVAKEGLEIARKIILDDLGTEIAEIENALSAIATIGD